MSDLVGVVPLEGRGVLPLSALHGEPLFVHSVRTLLRVLRRDQVVVSTESALAASARLLLGQAGVDVAVMDSISWWVEHAIAKAPSGVLLLDPLCPLVPASFVEAIVAKAASGGAVAGYGPVTDTVKSVLDQQIVGTLDRDRLAVITSPVVVPAALGRAGPPPARDFALLAAWLRLRGPLELVKSPSQARRVCDESAVQVLECLDELARRVQEV